VADSADLLKQHGVDLDTARKVIVQGALPRGHASSAGNFRSRACCGRIEDHPMRIAIAVMLIAVGATNAMAQKMPRTGAGKQPENASGRSVIPEKIGKPLQRGLISSDVKLRASDDRLGLPSAPHAPTRSRSR
jgi:hypothetical protein